MDKAKHKDGMLAAGKKRLEQFRQKKGKGSSSKAPKVENDGGHGNIGIDLEAGIEKNPKSKTQTSENAKFANDKIIIDLHPVEECRIEMEQRSEVSQVDSSEFSIQHTTSEVCDSIGPGQKTITETSASDEVRSPDRMNQEGCSTSLTSDFGISISSYSDEIPQDSVVSISPALTNMAKLQEVPNVLGEKGRLELGNEGEHAKAEANELQMCGTTIINNPSAIAEKKEDSIMEDRKDPRNFDVDVINVFPNQVHDVIHASKEEETLDRDMIGMSHNQGHCDDVLEPVMSPDSDLSTAELPRLGLDDAQGSEQCNDTLTQGISSGVSFNILDSPHVNIDANDHGQVPSKKFQEKPQLCEEEGMLHPEIGNDHGQVPFKKFQENPQLCEEEGMLHPEIGSDIGMIEKTSNIEPDNNRDFGEFTMVVHNEYSPESGFDSDINIPVNPVNDLNSQINDNYLAIASSKCAENILLVQRDEGTLELQIESDDVVIQTSAGSEEESNKTLDDNQSKFLHSDFSGEASVSGVTVSVSFSDTIGQHSDDCRMELNKQSSLGILTGSEDQQPANIAVDHTEIGSVQLETGFEAIAKRCDENTDVESCEASEGYILDKQTDRILEQDTLNNFTGIGLLDQKTKLKEDTNPIHIKQNVQILDTDLLTNDAGILSKKEEFENADLIQDGGALEMAENAFAGDSELVDSALESNAKDISCSMESCEDKRSNVSIGEHTTPEAILPSLVKIDVAETNHMSTTCTSDEDAPVNQIEGVHYQSEQTLGSIGSIVVEEVRNLISEIDSSAETGEESVIFLKQETRSINQEEIPSCNTASVEIDPDMKFHALEMVEIVNDLVVASASGVELAAEIEYTLDANSSKDVLNGDQAFVTSVESELNEIVANKNDAIEEKVNIQFSSPGSSTIGMDDSRPQIPSNDSTREIYFEEQKDMSADASLSNEDVDFSANVILINSTVNPLNEQESRASEGPPFIDMNLSERNLDPQNFASESSLLASTDNQGDDQKRLDDSQVLCFSSTWCTQGEKKVTVEERTGLTREFHALVHVKETESEGLQVEFNAEAEKGTDGTDVTLKVLMHVVGRLHHVVYQRIRPIEQISGVSHEAALSAASLETLQQDCDTWIDTLQENVEERGQMESAMRQLQDELSRREAHLAGVTTELTELSLKNYDLQRNLDEKMKSEMQVRQEFAEVSQNYEDTQKNLEETSNKENKVRQELNALTQKYESLQKDQEEKMKMEIQLRQLENLLSVRDTDIEKLSNQVAELSESYESLQKDQEEKMKKEIQLRQLENLLAVRDTDIEKLSNQVSELSESYNLVMTEAAKSSKVKDVLEADLEHIRSLYTEQEQKVLRMCLQASTLSERISAAVNTAYDSEDINTDSMGALEFGVGSLLEKYETNCVELKLLSQRALEVDSLKALTISEQEELTLLHSQLELSRNELTHAREEIFQQIEIKDGYLKQLTELSQRYEDLQKNLEGRTHIESKIGQLEDLLSIKDTDIQRLSEQVDSVVAEATKTSEEKFALESELKSTQTLYAEHKELYSRMCLQISTLSERIRETLGGPDQVEDIDCNSMAYMEHAVRSLLEQYGVCSAEIQLLLQKLNDSDAPAHEEVNELKTLMASKDIEISDLHDQISLLTSQLNRTNEESEQKVQQAEEKLLGVREKLSMAVTKGKALLQQRDNLKQLLAEKTAELDAITSSYKHEMQLKESALSEAYSKVKLYAESVDRVEALESELSYIRNSANALRESFLQKDAILQKLEELLEDSNLPEEIQLKDIFEKVDFLIEAYSQRNLLLEREGQPQVRGLESSGTDPDSQTQEIEELNRKCDDLLRKYRGMAEQSAMLEQSLVERNLIIQKWEQVLDAIEMPPTVKSKETEDRIEWLGNEVSDSYARSDLLQQEVETLKATIESLNNALHKLQVQNDMISSELEAKEKELKVAVMDLEDMNSKYNSTSRLPLQVHPEIGVSERSYPDEAEQERNEQIQSPVQHADLETLIASFPTMLGDVVQEEEIKRTLSAPTTSIAIGQLVKLLGDNCRDLAMKIADAKAEVEKLLASSLVDKERESELNELREALSLKIISESNLCQQIEELQLIKSALENEVNESQTQVKALSEKLSLMRNEIAKSTMEASQSEEKLASVREKLSLAIKKGKNVVQQRDALKQSLEEKIAELNKVIKEREAGDMALKKAEQNVKHLLQRLDLLEAELSTSKDQALNIERSLQESNRALQKFIEVVGNLSMTGAPHSADIGHKIQWLSQTVVDAQKRIGVSEQEAKKSKRAVELLALEVEETQERLDSLNEELKLAENNISILIEDKKKVEAAKAETVFRLEHAMANINSLLFELNQSKESVGKFEREKTALSAQLEELGREKEKSLEQLKDLPHLYSKVNSLKDCQGSLLKMLANECLKLAEDIKGSNALAIRLSEEFSSLEVQTTNATFIAHEHFMKDPYPTMWKSELLVSHKDWKQGVDTSSMKLLCEMMESDLQSFGSFLNNFIVAASQDSVAMSQLLFGACNEIHLISQKMKNQVMDADVSTSLESLILQKDKEIANLDVQLKTVVERVKTSIVELEGVRRQIQLQSINNSRFDILDSDVASTDLEKLALSLVGRLDCAVKDLALYVEESGEIKKQNQELTSQLTEAELICSRMDEQQHQDKLKITELQKSLEACELNVQRMYEELHSHQDILSIKKQEESKLVGALNKAETQVSELSAKIEELQKSKQDLEASLSKASSRFSATVNNFNNFKRLAEKLIEEAQGQHLLLEGRDAQNSQLRDEIALKRSEIASLKILVDDKTTNLSQIYKRLKEIIGKDNQGVELPSESDSQIDVNSINELLGTLATRMQVGSEDLRIELARKDALLQDMQMRHNDLAGKVNFLQASLQENQRILEEKDDLIMPEKTRASTQVDETGNRAKLIIQSPAVVTRGRKVSASDQFVVDVDMQSDRSLLDSTDDDKGHMFKPLTASRLIPRGARFLVDRIDGFWVSGERLLMRRPEARLSVMLYWVILHIWMTVLLF